MCKQCESWDTALARAQREIMVLRHLHFASVALLYGSQALLVVTLGPYILMDAYGKLDAMLATIMSAVMIAVAMMVENIRLQRLVWHARIAMSSIGNMFKMQQPTEQQQNNTPLN
jgi:hypothetical protein